MPQWQSQQSYQKSSDPRGDQSLSVRDSPPLSWVIKQQHRAGCVSVHCIHSMSVTELLYFLMAKTQNTKHPAFEKASIFPRDSEICALAKKTTICSHLYLPICAYMEREVEKKKLQDPQTDSRHWWKLIRYSFNLSHQSRNWVKVGCKVACWCKQL